MGPPGWLVGPVAAVTALAILGFQFALFASGEGLLIAGGAAFWIGPGIAAFVDPKRQLRNAMIVAVTIAVRLSGYLRVVSSRPPPPGASQGGPNLPRPGRARARRRQNWAPRLCCRCRRWLVSTQFGCGCLRPGCQAGSRRLRDKSARRSASSRLRHSLIWFQLAPVRATTSNSLIPNGRNLYPTLAIEPPSTECLLNMDARRCHRRHVHNLM